MDRFKATIKDVIDTDHGGFLAVASTAAVDRDGESILPGAFEPLPESIPIYHGHDWQKGATPIGRGRPFYEGEQLMVDAKFASTDRAQEIRTLVAEGIIDSVSVGFLNGRRTKGADGPEVTSGDLFEASLTAIPANPEAVLLAAKDVAAVAEPVDEFAGHVTFELAGVKQFRAPYTIEDGEVVLGAAVEIVQTIQPSDKTATEAAEAAEVTTPTDHGGDAPEAAEAATEDTKAIDDRLAGLLAMASPYINKENER